MQIQFSKNENVIHQKVIFVIVHDKSINNDLLREVSQMRNFWKNQSCISSHKAPQYIQWSNKWSVVSVSSQNTQLLFQFPNLCRNKSLYGSRRLLTPGTLSLFTRELYRYISRYLVFPWRAARLSSIVVLVSNRHTTKMASAPGECRNVMFYMHFDELCVI